MACAVRQSCGHLCRKFSRLRESATVSIGAQPISGGVVQIDLDHPSRRRIAFDGRQPESCEVLRQAILVEPGRRYSLRWQVQLNGLNLPTGIEWRVAGAHAPVDAKELVFTATSRIEELTLNYARPRGEARGEGSIDLSSITLKQ